MNYSQFREQQKSFRSSEGIIKYIDKGKGEVLLLLHGIPTSGWLYRKMIDKLASRYRIIVPDMLGFGASDSPNGYDIYNQKSHALRLLGLMDFLQVQQWSHVFHDAGGLWTWELINSSPKRIKNLIVLNTIIYQEGFNPPLKFKKGFLTKCIMSMYSNGITTNAMLKGLFKEGLLHNDLTKEDIQGYKKSLLEGKTKAMYQFFSTTCQKLPNYEDVIKQLKIPVLLIWGKHDSFLVLAKMEDKVVNDLKLAEENIHIIDAKHFIQEEKPQVVSSLILNFLKKENK